MTIRDLQGRLFQPGFIADIPTGNLLWVDQINGNDDLAVRGRMTVPFKTLTKAKTAAASGDTIMVLPGTYNENNLLKNGVNWHFLSGAIVSYSGSGAAAIFDTSSNGTNGAVQSIVSGWGEFVNQSSVASGHVVHSVASNSAINIQAGRMLCGGTAACVKLVHTSGQCRIEVKSSIEASAGRAVEIGGGSGNPNANVIRVYKLYSSGGPAIYIGAGNVHLQAHYVSSSADVAVSLAGGSGSNVVIQAYELSSSSSHAVHYSATTNPDLTIIGARIKCNYDNPNFHSIYVAAGGSDHIRLAGCSLLAYNASSKAFSALSNTTVQFHGLSIGQRGASNLTPVPSAGWIPNTAIT
jgi:hypothetical protein